MSTLDGTVLTEASTDALAPGSQLLSGQYEIIRHLSSGGFGITYLARDSLDRTVVIKECFPEAFCSRVDQTVQARISGYVDDFRSIVTHFMREAQALSRLDHPGVVGVHQVFEDNGTAYMALDLVDGQDLLAIIEGGGARMRPAQVQRLTLALLDAIAHVHSQDLLHRDISPDNILVATSGQPVMIDFGAAREEAGRKTRVLSTVLVVKDGYSPQEFYVAGSQQYPCSDLYALGASLSHLITGDAPPNSQARLAALAGDQPDLYQPLRGRFPGYDDAFLSAIDKAMHIVPAQRIQSAEDWMLMIDPTKRVEKARARALDDEAISLTISNLIRSTQDDGAAAAADQPTAAAAPVAPETPAHARRVDPKYNSAFLRDLYPDGDAVRAADPDAADDLSDEVSPKAAPPRDQTIQDGPADAAPGQHAEPRSPEPDPAAAPPDHSIIGTPAHEDHGEVAASVTQRVSRRRLLARAAIIPLIFVLYYAVGHVALQFDGVYAMTVGQIITIGETHGYWAPEQVGDTMGAE